MRLSGLVVATLFFLSSIALGQHSSGSSGSSGGSFSGGGGGSHGGSSGGSSSGSSGGSFHSSSSSSGAHSSGASSPGGASSHGSSSHGSSARGSNSASRAAVSPTHGLRSTEARNAGSIREPNGSLRPGAQPEKRSFFSFLRHPFRRPDPKPVADLRKPVCLRGPCQICPNGQMASGGCGGVTVVHERMNHGCWGHAVWTGSPCMLETHYLDDCSALRTMVERQAHRMQAAESIRQSACAAAGSSECSEATASWQSEQNLYRSLQQRYQQCRVQSGHTLSGNYSTQGHGLNLFDPLRFDARY